MGMHCPTCSCSQCQIQENRYSEISGPVTYVDRNGNRYQDGKYVGHQSEIDTSNDWINERNIPDRPRQEKIIWRKGQPNYPGSYEGSQVISHVTQQGNSQTFYVDRSLPPQSVRGFQQTYHQDPNQQWERIPDSPLPEEMQRQVNRQMHGLAEQLRQQYGAQNVQVHQAFIQPHQLTPELISKLPPEQQQQIRQYQQQVGRQKQQPQQQIQQQPKQGFWDRLRGRQAEQPQLVRSLNQCHTLTPQQQQRIIQICKQNKAKEEIGGVITSRGEVIQLPNQAKNKHDHFQFKWNGLDAVAIWHEHLAENGHAKGLSGNDIAAANQSGLSMYACYSGDWSFVEYHPNGTPNRTPRRDYEIQFSCPSNQKLNDIYKAREKAIGYIKEDNDRYQKAVIAANETIKGKQQQAISLATQTLTTASDIKTKSEAIAARLNFATNQPKLLPQGVNQNVRMGKQQPKQLASLHAGQRDNSTTRNTNRSLCLPESGRVAADRGRNERVTVEGWFDRKSDKETHPASRR